MYAPFGAGALVGPRRAFVDGDPFLAGGGAVDLVDLDEVVWTDPPEREEAGSPNVLGAIALHAAIDEFDRIGWSQIEHHDVEIARSPSIRVSTRFPASDCSARIWRRETLPVATFTVDGVHHALVAARLSAEYGIGVRHGCFCAHPYLLRLLDLSDEQVHAYREAVLDGDRREIPGAVRASAGLSTIERPTSIAWSKRSAAIADGSPAPVTYRPGRTHGRLLARQRDRAGWTADDRTLGASCARG